MIWIHSGILAALFLGEGALLERTLYSSESLYLISTWIGFITDFKTQSKEVFNM
jgi:hypothetical protein